MRARSMRHHHRLALIVLGKLGIVVLVVALPAGLAISLGAAHAVILVLILAAGAAVLVTRRWRNPPRRGPSPGRGPMLTALAHIHTETPGRYLAQLCRHATRVHQKIGHVHIGGLEDRPHVRHAEWSDTDGNLVLSVGRCTMHADGHTLTVRVDADTEQNLRQIQDVVARNLERFGRREHLTVTWQRPDAPTAAAGKAG